MGEGGLFDSREFTVNNCLLVAVLETIHVTFCIEFSLEAVLMVIAWVGFATVGMFIARYMRPVWGEKNMCGKRVWFQVGHSNVDEQESINSRKLVG